MHEKQRVLISAGLRYERTDDKEFYNTEGMDNQRAKDMIDNSCKEKTESNNHEIYNLIQKNREEKWREQIAKYEQIIDEQRCNINKLQSDLQRSNQKIEILEDINKKMLNSINPVKRNIFPQSSTPVTSVTFSSNQIDTHISHQ